MKSLCKYSVSLILDIDKVPASHIVCGRDFQTFIFSMSVRTWL